MRPNVCSQLIPGDPDSLRSCDLPRSSGCNKRLSGWMITDEYRIGPIWRAHESHEKKKWTTLSERQLVHQKECREKQLAIYREDRKSLSLCLENSQMHNQDVFSICPRGRAQTKYRLHVPKIAWSGSIYLSVRSLCQCKNLFCVSVGTGQTRPRFLNDIIFAHTSSKTCYTSQSRNRRRVILPTI